MMNRAKLQRGEVVIDRESIHSAMKLYNNLEELGRDPLARLIIVEIRRKKAAYPETVNGFGWALQGLLFDALASLKPSGEEPETPGKEWHLYFVLKERYIKGTAIGYIKDSLGFGVRTVKRRLKVALQRVSDIFLKWEEEARAVQSDRHQLAAIPDKPRNHEIVGRDELISSIKAQLLKGEEDISIALQGDPGVGKTAIAVELAHDPEIEDYFQGGILWAGLEEETKKTKWTKKRKTAEILMQLSRWGEVLGISAESLKKVIDIEDRKRLLEQEIRSGRWLIVMDNVWDLDLARGLQLKAPNCVHLITTRKPDTAHKFAPHYFIPVSELPVADSQKLIAQLAPEAQKKYPRKVEEIVQAVGGLPLSLILMGNYLRAVSLSRQLRPLENVIQQLSLPENRLVSSGQDVTSTRPKGFPKDIPASIEFSEKMLDDRSRQVFQSLSLLPPEPNSFPKEAALAVSGLETPELIDKLYHLGLLERFKDDRYSMHPTIHELARLRFKEKAAYTRMIDYYVRLIKDAESDFLSLDLEVKNILTALEIAHTRGKRLALVKGVNSLFGYLYTRGMYPTAKLHFERALKSAEALKDNKGIATTRSNLGSIAIRLGEYQYAKDCFEIGLALARRTKDRKSVCALLDSLGQLQKQLGEIDVAQNCLKEGLQIARQIHDRFRVASILASLGAIEFNRGNYKQSRVFLLKGVNIARKLKNHDLSTSLLSNLGVMVERQAQRAKAREYYLESLSHARKTGNLEQICQLHLYLGTVEQHLGNSAQAQEYALEALRIAKEELRDPEKICTANISLGAQAGERGEVDTAESYLQEALKLARTIGHPDRTSYVLYNLGGYEIVRENFALAKEYLTESLQIAQKINLSLFIVLTRMSLGVAAYKQGHYRSAYNYLKAALAHAQKNNQRDTESDILNEFGNLYVATEKLDKAKAVLEQSVDIAVETGSRDFEAQALYQLSQIDNMQGNKKRAIQLARKSLKLFVSIKYQTADDVKRYLKDELGVT